MFLTGNNDPEVAREALGTGATGYVSKLDAAVELLSAVEAVSAGKAVRQYNACRRAGDSRSPAVSALAPGHEAFALRVPKLGRVTLSE
ncbi:MAG: hypothetical protein WBV55_05005 [Candidatus Sulfotelmatobacter sp.]